MSSPWIWFRQRYVHRDSLFDAFEMSWCDGPTSFPPSFLFPSCLAWTQSCHGPELTCQVSAVVGAPHANACHTDFVRPWHIDANLGHHGINMFKLKCKLPHEACWCMCQETFAGCIVPLVVCLSKGSYVCLHGFYSIIIIQSAVLYVSHQRWRYPQHDSSSFNVYCLNACTGCAPLTLVCKGILASASGLHKGIAHASELIAKIHSTSGHLVSEKF